MRDEPVADPSLIRSLDTGQAAYIYRGGVTFIQIKRLIAAPPALTAESITADRPGGPAGAERRSPGSAPPGSTGGAERPAPPPDAGPLLDDAFGGEPG
jgi:hypothetical protein